MPNNTNNQKKYASLTTLQTFLDNIKALFVKKTDLETTLSGYDTKGSAAAVQENLDTVSDTLKEHTDNTDIHVTTSNKSNWNSAYTHSTSAHARTDATKVEMSRTNGNILINGVETSVYNHRVSGVTPGRYTNVTVNSEGHVTGGYNPTTLKGYGITDAETKSDASAKLTEAKTYTDTVASTKSDSNHNHNDLYDTKSAVNTKIDTHNASTTAHNDIRLLISGLTTRLNTLADSDDTTLDQLSEIVTYIKNNKSLIDGITTNKVNVSDIINNLTTNVSNKPLSAAQGVAIKALIDDLQEELDSHSTDIVKHITSDERTDWNTAKTLAENALPTSGGTMTGAITMTQANFVKRDKDTSNVAIYGGTDSANGATITVYGKEQAIYPGYFSLKANNGEASATLEGRPDGTLKWSGKNIVALGTSEALPISSGGTGATKASDALENLGGLPKSNPSVTGSFSMNKLHSSTTGLYSVVEGYNCSATGNYGAHAEGYYSEANGDNSHAEGDGAIANGVGAHAEGYKTIASEDYSHVQGKYNIEDTENQYAHIVGNGTSNSNRSNAHTLDWDGNAWFAGNVYVGGESQNEGLKLLTSDDLNWNLIYDSGEISAIANSIAGINVSGYTKFRVVVRCYNDGDSYGDRTGSAIFKAQNGKSYQFPVWTNMFSKSISTVSAMADFELTDDWLVCPHASRLVGEIDIFDTAEGGTAGNLTPSGSGILKCTSPLSTLTISSLDQNSRYYFGIYSRVMVWGV